MRSKRSVASLTIGGLLALTSSVFINPHKADADQYPTIQCLKSVVGTYLATANRTNSTPVNLLPFREIITLTADGNLIANDSTAGGIPGSSNTAYQPYGPLQGSWKCTGNNKIVATTLNFAFPSGSLAGLIGVSKYQLSFNTDAHTVTGNVSFTFFDLNSNPLDTNTQPLPGGDFEYSYSGNKLTIEQK